MRKLGWVVGLAFAAAGGAGCGEPFTTTGGAGGATSATSTTSTGMGGSQGTSASVSAAVGTGGQGGAGVSVSSASSGSSSGAPSCTPTSCSMNAYCDSSKGACVDCTDFSRFHFGQPFQLTVPLPGTGSARFPRLSPADGTMYLSYTQGTSTLLATAGYQSFPTWGAAMLLTSPPNPPSTSGADFLGPLVLSDGGAIHDLDPSIPGGAVLLFDAPTTLSAGILRKVFAYPVDSGQQPVQLALPGSSNTTSEWRIAVASDTHRLWWLSSSPQGLVTAKPGDSTAVAVPVLLDDGSSAPIANQPWVTPDGKILVFATAYAKQVVTHVFYSEIDPQSGLTKGNATRIYPMDATDSDGDPSLAGNACALLFTRNDALWGALRD